MKKREEFDQKALTIADLKGLVAVSLTDEPRTAGEITDSLEASGFDVRRGAVKRHLDALVTSGEAWLSRQDVTRRGHLVKAAAHYQRAAF